MQSDAGDHLVWVDLETTGLEPDNDLILEVGFLVTSLDLTAPPIASYDTVVRYPRPETIRYANDFVRDMHKASGLDDSLLAGEGRPLHLIEVEAVEFLKEWVPPQHAPLCGSSVHFDRAMLKSWLPNVEAFFHYRNIDISTLKELSKRLNPRVASRLDEQTSPKKLHRALPDLYDTINEAQFYIDNFLFVDPEALA